MALKKKGLFAFAFLNVPLSLGGLPLGLYLAPYYATELGISLATIGVVLMLTRVTDVLTDPLIGTLSDRTPAKYGRRGLWLIIGTPVMAISTIAVFDPFITPGPLYLFICIAGRRIGEIAELKDEIAAWSSDVNNRQRGVDWQLKIDEARCKLKSVYPQIKL